MLTVKPDPRVETPLSVYEQRYAMMKDLQKLTAAATQATDRLREAKEIAEEFEQKIRKSQRTDLKEAADKTKAMKDSVNALFDFILGKEDNRQGILRSPEPSPVSYIQTAAGYIMRSRDPISETDRRVYKHAEDKIDAVVKKVNYFFENTWKDYRVMMEKVQLSPFKDYTPIKYR
jgi:predicted RNase H-like nuclease